jgi:hypothetical protein
MVIVERSGNLARGNDEIINGKREKLISMTMK